MLYGYPIAATRDNWVHDCICTLFESIHTHIQASSQLPQWRDLVPQGKTERHKKLASRERTLGVYVANYDAELRKLSDAERQATLAAIKTALSAHNQIEKLLEDPTCNCPTLAPVPQSVLAPFREIFEYGFDPLLKDLKIRQQHYEQIYNCAPAKVCPFCGIMPFNAPDGPQEAYDHYLARSIYPSAAVNLENLVPMCGKCNSSYKKTADILRDTGGCRRKAFYPYKAAAVWPAVSLDQSEPFLGKQGRYPHPKWCIEFISPAADEVSTWNEIFEIRERYERDILDKEYDNWLEILQKYVRRERIVVQTNQQIIDELRRWEDREGDYGLQSTGFIKAAVYRMLRLHCARGHERLLQFFRDLFSR